MSPHLGVWERALQNTLPEKQYPEVVCIGVRNQIGCVTLANYLTPLCLSFLIYRVDLYHRHKN
jgi:hypothetical protein